MKGAFPIFAAAALALDSCAQDSTGVRRAESPAPAGPAIAGHAVFLKNCAACHGADAHGDEGPDLHNLDWTDEQIASRIRNGKKGQMTAFRDKLNNEQISALITYLHGLK